MIYDRYIYISYIINFIQFSYIYHIYDYICVCTVHWIWKVHRGTDPENAENATGFQQLIQGCVSTCLQSPWTAWHCRPFENGNTNIQLMPVMPVIQTWIRMNQNESDEQLCTAETALRWEWDEGIGVRKNAGMCLPDIAKRFTIHSSSLSSLSSSSSSSS